MSGLSSRAKSPSPGAMPPEGATEAQALLDEAWERFDDRQFRRAESLCHGLLQANPRIAGALGLLGLISLAEERFADVIELCGRAVALSQKEPAYFSALGKACRALGRNEEAAAHFRQAAALTPDSPAARTNLGLALLAQGDPAAAIAPFRQVVEWEPDNPLARNNLGTALMDDGQPGEAADCFTTALALKPDLLEGLLNLGAAQTQLARWRGAADSYRKALALRSGQTGVLFDLGVILRRLGEPAEAAERFQAFLDKEPDHIPAIHHLGWACHELGRLREAAALFRRALDLNPAIPEAHLNLGLIDLQQGRLSAAASWFDQTLALRPAAPHAHRLRALCRPFVPGDSRLEPMAALHPRLKGAPRAEICFGLGKAWEDLGRHQEAFARIQEGNRLIRAGIDYDPGRTEAEFRALKVAFSADFFAARANWGADWGAGADVKEEAAGGGEGVEGAQEGDSDGAGRDASPIFIVGMPRAGLSLTARILASHPMVGGGTESRLARRIVADRMGIEQLSRAGPRLLALTREATRQLGEAFLAELAQSAGPGRRALDQSVENLPRLGFIRLLLPHARVIHMRRSALDLCWSIYKTRFAGGFPYAYDLAELGHYFRWSEDLMAHWRAAAPERCCDLRFEELLANPEKAVRRVLTFCGLPWDRRCLEPLVVGEGGGGRSGVGLWRAYEKNLAPLLTALGVAPETLAPSLEA